MNRRIAKKLNVVASELEGRDQPQRHSRRQLRKACHVLRRDYKGRTTFRRQADEVELIKRPLRTLAVRAADRRWSLFGVTRQAYRQDGVPLFPWEPGGRSSKVSLISDAFMVAAVALSLVER